MRERSRYRDAMMFARTLGAVSVVASLIAAGCSSSAPETPAETGPTPDPATVPGHEIGTGDGSAGSVVLTELYSMGAAAKPTDLAFSETGELWIVGYGDNSLHRGTGVTEDAPSFARIVDPAATHFMLKPPAIAIGAPGYFGTCGDNLNEHGGGDGSAAMFMGPALFVTDPAILGKRTAGGLGSHVDMLHNTPLCRGIAHVRANIYWVFNGLDHSLDRYDFHEPHEPGGDDHADGEIYRYAMGDVRGVEDGTPSHLFYDPNDGFLWVADTGNARIVKLDTTKGKLGAPLERVNEPLAGDGVMDGTAVEEVVPPGTLTKPSGLEVHNDLLYVTDAASSSFHVFDKTGKRLRSLATDLPPGSLAGMAFGADQKLYFTDRASGRVLRIDVP